jgi:hypothetical protein
MQCYGNSESPSFSIQRQWAWVYEQGTLTPIYYQDPTDFAPGSLCATAAPFLCGGSVDSSSGSADPDSSSPFAITFGSLTPAAPNETADPIGGSVSLM